MIICICHGVSDRHIAAQARAGCLGFDELQFETGVATRCGCCRECAASIFEQHRAPAGTPMQTNPSLPAGAGVTA